MSGVQVAFDHAPEVTLTTDASLLVRVIVNMVRNAVEASREREPVRVSAELGDETVIFSVHNVAVLAPAVERHIFQRSFSTKGRGRGLGTYGMRLLGEQHLGGRVGFVSSAHEGTRFFMELPRAPTQRP